ncbi:hypothetical protein MSKOL_0900 [Methanosarcina sp. Kolksee]|nr:hypothetical protein MSKOL_0900 [Methanosarcina sp. Kolksee]
MIVVASLVLMRCEFCLDVHSQRTLIHGSSKQEIAESIDMLHLQQLAIKAREKQKSREKRFFCLNGFWEIPLKDSRTAKFRPENIQYCFSGIKFEKNKKAVSKKN